MPRNKITETAPAAEIKAEVVTEAVKDSAAEAKAEKKSAAEAKAEKKSAAKKAPAKKSSTRKTASKTASKTAKAVTAPKETVKVQFGGDEYDFAEIKKAVEADYKGKVKGKIIAVEIYIKPEDKAVYYVVNSDYSGKIEL